MKLFTSDIFAANDTISSDELNDHFIDTFDCAVQSVIYLNKQACSTAAECVAIFNTAQIDDVIVTSFMLDYEKFEHTCEVVRYTRIT